MKDSTTTALGLFALSFVLPLAGVASPACLLSAVNEQDKPSDLAAICGANAGEVQAAIDSLCESQNKSVAQADFLSTCTSVGSSVAAYTPTTSTTESASRTGSGASNTASEIAGGASASASGSGSGSGSSGASSGPSDAKAFGGAVILFAGVLGLAIGL